MTNKYRTLFITQRGLRHQQAALSSAPDCLDLWILRSPSRQQILAALQQAEFLITERSGVIDAEMIAAGKQLRLIQRLGSQTWDLDVEAARRFGVPVCYWPVRTTILVAEHMVMQILTLLKRVREDMQITQNAADWGIPSRKCDEDYFAYNWSSRSEIKSLYHARVGILGFGEVGFEVARRLKGFECEMLYNKRQRLPLSAEQELGIQFASREQMLCSCDVICSLLPYFPETVNSLDQEFFSRMRPGAVLVHCGAGGVVDEGALIAALKSGQLSGAALDTFSWEPLRPEDPLLILARDPLSNLILTPHVAAGSPPAGSGRDSDYTNILAVLEGKPLQYQL